MINKENHPDRKQIPEEDTSEDPSRKCPKCGHKMMKGTMEGGLSHGQQYWCCTNYPGCGYIQPA